MKIYQHIATRLAAIINCVEAQNKEWEEKHRAFLNNSLISSPSGSGIDSGTKFDWDGSEPNSLRFFTAFHHMDEGGGYDGWTEHSIVVHPDLQFGFTLHVSGKNRNGIKEYLVDTYYEWLNSEVDKLGFSLR